MNTNYGSELDWKFEILLDEEVPKLYLVATEYGTNEVKEDFFIYIGNLKQVPEEELEEPYIAKFTFDGGSVQITWHHYIGGTIIKFENEDPEFTFSLVSFSKYPPRELIHDLENEVKRQAKQSARNVAAFKQTLGSETATGHTPANWYGGPNTASTILSVPGGPRNTVASFLSGKPGPLNAQQAALKANASATRRRKNRKNRKHRKSRRDFNL